MIPNSRILVTGPTGFIGQRLCEVLAAHGHAVRTAERRQQGEYTTKLCGVHTDRLVVGNINETTEWSEALADVYGIIHLAGRAHILRERHINPLAAYRQTNVSGTLRLAEAAAAAGVRRFVYVSSIKVNGETTIDKPFTVSDMPAPLDPYGISKWEAEQGLRQIERKTGLEVVIVRPPLVYGPGVKGNFLSLLRWVQRGLPLPLAHCDNRRSLIGVTNLADLLTRCVEHPRASGKLILAGDGEDLSTPELVRRLARAMNRTARLLPVPASFLHFATRALGKPGIYERLCGSLQIDICDTRQSLEWSPPSTIDEELAKTALWFLQQGGSA